MGARKGWGGGEKKQKEYRKPVYVCIFFVLVPAMHQAAVWVRRLISISPKTPIKSECSNSAFSAVSNMPVILPLIIICDEQKYDGMGGFSFEE